MSRIFSTAGVLLLANGPFQVGVQVLADSVPAASVDVVIGIARGGVRLAKLVAECLGRPHAVVSASHNTDDAIRQPASGLVSVDLEAATTLDHGLRVLVCDDIYGTGATLAAVRGALDAAIVPRMVLTATLCRNEGATGYPDRWLWDVRDWVVFPWEPSVSAGEIGRLTAPLVARRHP